MLDCLHAMVCLLQPFMVPLSSLVEVFESSHVLCIYLVNLIVGFVVFVKCVGLTIGFSFVIKKAKCGVYCEVSMFVCNC